MYFILTAKIFFQSPIGIMTTSAGKPIPVSETSSTLNTRLIFNEYLMDTLTHFSRERLPERVVHAKGTGAFGYFEVTNDITNICKASIFSKIGKRTPIAVRFSSIITERGASDVSRDVRGFAVKFYSERGNFDMVGLNHPVFVTKDARLFTTFIHSQKRNPATHLFDKTTFWDYLTLQPESFNLFLRLLSDLGIPDGYIHMPGYSIHTLQVENSKGDIFFVRFHLIPKAGVKNLTAEEASKISANDPDYGTRHLYNSIAKGIFPCWTFAAQIVTPAQVEVAGADRIFDVTRILPLHEYPLTKIGKIVLNRNYLNYFADIEQLALHPSNLIEGILGAPDNIFEARRLSYRDALYYRLGANYNRVKVNCPLNDIFTYDRDGRPYLYDNMINIPNYYPNSFNGPVPYMDNGSQPLIQIKENEPNNFDQMTEFYVNDLTDDQRDRLIENIVNSLKFAAKFIQERATKIFSTIHPELGAKVKKRLIRNRYQEIIDQEFDIS